MAKLIITIEEKSEPLGEERTLYGFGVTQDVNLEGSEHSMLPSMGPILTALVMHAIAIIQQGNGGHLHKADTSDRSISLESHIADFKTEIEQPISFPSEL